MFFSLLAVVTGIPMPLGPYKGWNSFPASFFGADIHGVEGDAEMELVARHQVVSEAASMASMLRAEALRV